MEEVNPTRAAANAARWPRRKRFDVKGILLFLLVGFGLYCAWQYVPPYLRRRQMEDAAAPIVQRAARQQLDLADVKAQLSEQARACGLPADHHIELSRAGRTVTAQIQYQETIHLPGTPYQRSVVIALRDLGY